MRRDPSAAVSPVQTTGERLLDVGDRVTLLLRRGRPLPQIADRLGIGDHTCQLALLFRTAPDLIKLRAMVEEWNVFEIRSRLQQTEKPEFH